MSNIQFPTITPLQIEFNFLKAAQKWTHWDLNPGRSAAPARTKIFHVSPSCPRSGHPPKRPLKTAERGLSNLSKIAIASPLWMTSTVIYISHLLCFLFSNNCNVSSCPLLWIGDVNPNGSRANLTPHGGATAFGWHWAFSLTDWETSVGVGGDLDAKKNLFKGKRNASLLPYWQPWFNHNKTLRIFHHLGTRWLFACENHDFFC